MSRTDKASVAGDQPSEDYLRGYYPLDDEIDLFELVAGLWRRRVLIVGCTIFFACVGIFYVAVLADAVFVAETRAAPVTNLALSPLNDAVKSTAPSSDLQFSREDMQLSITAENALGLVMATAQSPRVQQTLLESLKDNDSASRPRALGTQNHTGWKEMLGSISVDIIGPKNNPPDVPRELSIKVSHNSADSAASVANALMTTAHDQAREALVGDLKFALSARLAAARREFDRSSPEAEQSSASRVARLEGLLEYDFSNINLLRVEQVATPPKSPVKPKKGLIITAATVAGAMLGVLLALILNAIEARRKGESNSA
jgi:LPS O-antigen subunit length determinant protein (WzzB/FepE family)